MNNSPRVEDPEREKDDRYARFRLIDWWDQDKLRRANVLVVGAGALGNEILKNLVLLGVGRILVADMDTIENSNLSRSVLFREADNGRRKAEVAAKSAGAINPDVAVHWFHGDVIHDLGLGVFRWADLVIAGLDNREARLSVNRGCWKTGKPWIDGAIERLDGVVRVFVPPHGACYECTMGQADWDILKSRKSCNLLTRDDMLAGKVPTTPTSASVIAGIQCQEAVKLLHGLEVLESKGYIFHGLTHDSYVVAYPKKDPCFSHETYGRVEPLGRGVAGTKAGEIVADIERRLGRGAVVEFNREIVASMDCLRCGTSTPVFKALGKMTERDALCPACGEPRDPQILHSLNGDEPFLDKSLAEIGIPPFDIIVGRKGTDEIYLEFDADAPRVLGPLFQSRPTGEGAT